MSKFHTQKTASRRTAGPAQPVLPGDPQDSVFAGDVGTTAIDSAKMLMQQYLSGGDLNIQLSKSRLRLRIDEFYRNLFNGINTEQSLATFKAFLKETQTFKDGEHEVRYLQD